MAIITCISCESPSIEKSKQDQKSNPPQAAKSVFPPFGINININITFEPIRLARAMTIQNGGDRNCSCNECFGVCNRSQLTDGNDDGVIASIGFEEISKNDANIYILNSIPSNFEDKFGIDEPVNLKDANGKILYTLRPGEYQAVKEEGIATCKADGKSYPYYVKIKVSLL